VFTTSALLALGAIGAAPRSDDTAEPANTDPEAEVAKEVQRFPT